MKQLFKQLTIFLLPLILLFGCVEALIIWYPNTFNVKANYLRHNLDAEILFLGSSHIQNGVDPSVFDKKAINMGYGSQDPQLDSALFFRYINQLDELKVLVLEADYQYFEMRNPPDYFRLPWYYRFHDVELEPLSPIQRYSMYLSSRKFFNNYLSTLVNPNATKYQIEEDGFISANMDGAFEDLDYDQEAIKESAAERLSNKYAISSVSNFEFNKPKVDAIIEYCGRHDIEVFLLKSPLYETYRSNYKEDKLQRRDSYLDEVLVHDFVHLLDFESSDSFTVKDFKDDSHLNSGGAKKLSMAINDSINHRILRTFDVP